MRKVVICCVLFLCTTAVLMNACSPKKKPPASKPVPVVVAAAIKKTIPIEITAMGSVEPFQTISVRTQITAQIAKVLIKEGQDVKKGELLLTLDCRMNEAALAQAKANLVRDKAQTRYAKEQVRRYADLIKKDYVAREQFEQIQANADALEATLKADEAIVESNLTQMQYCSIYSPVDGRTGMLKVNQGNIVKANDTEILTINQIQPINVTFAIPEKDLAGVKRYSAAKTLKVEAVIPGEDRPESGELTSMDNAIDKTTGTITIKGTFANKAKRLVPGQFVNVVLTLTTQPDAVLIPTQGVEQGQTGQYVYVIGPDSLAELRPVTIGSEIKGETVIEKGLKQGERVVTDGQMRLIPGVKVTMKKPK